MCAARDSNSLAALSAIVAYVLLLIEELASLTDHRFKAAASGLPLRAFLSFNDAQA